MAKKQSTVTVSWVDFRERLRDQDPAGIENIHIRDTEEEQMRGGKH